MDAQLRLIARAEAIGETEGEPTRGPGGHPGGRATPAARRPRSSRRSSTTDEPVEAPVRWRIDESARARGRAGISQAREALRRARRTAPDGTHTTAA
jgi:hypothetical protein